MRLVVDASVLVAELLRVAGRERLTDQRLDLFIAEQTLNEVRHELPKRAHRFVERHHRPAPDAARLTQACFDAIDLNIATVPEAAYSPHEAEARWRSPRDPHDWPTVAAAMTVDAGVWTEDGDFLGTGVATWTTATLRAWLAHQEKV